MNKATDVPPLTNEYTIKYEETGIKMIYIKPDLSDFYIFNEN
jgi:hypothetical protein